MIAAIAVITELYIRSQKQIANDHSAFMPTKSLFLVLFAGLIGGFISVQQRLQQPTEIDPLYKWLELDASGISLLAAPLIGMVFATVLFAIFVGGFVNGGLFPEFLPCTRIAGAAIHCANSDLASLAYGSTPNSPASWAKLTVWAFAAGFLERLVPDILTRIAAVAEK